MLFLPPSPSLPLPPFLSRLHEVLMDLQQQQLQQLSDWLSRTEERIKKIETEPGAKDLELYKERIEQHKVNMVSHSNVFCESLNLFNEVEHTNNSVSLKQSCHHLVTCVVLKFQE